MKEVKEGTPRIKLDRARVEKADSENSNPPLEDLEDAESDEESESGQ